MYRIAYLMIFKRLSKVHRADPFYFFPESSVKWDLTEERTVTAVTNSSASKQSSSSQLPVSFYFFLLLHFKGRHQYRTAQHPCLTQRCSEFTLVCTLTLLTCSPDSLVHGVTKSHQQPHTAVKLPLKHHTITAFVNIKELKTKYTNHNNKKYVAIHLPADLAFFLIDLTWWITLPES